MLAATLCAGLFAQGSRLSLGVRGGAATYSLPDNMAGQLGPMGMLDLGYTYLWPVPNGLQLGLHLGASAGYMQSSFSMPWTQSFTAEDYLGRELSYKVTASDITESFQQLQLEIPLQLAIASSNFFAHVGVKVMSPIAWNRYQQTVSEDLLIKARYAGESQSYKNQTETGKADVSQLSSAGSFATPVLTISAAVDLGYEWTIADKHHIDLGVYADFGIWSYSPVVTPLAFDEIISVVPASSATNPASVTIHPIHQVYWDAMRYFDLGVKLCYSVELSKKEAVSAEPDLVEKAESDLLEAADEEAKAQAKREAQVAKEAEKARKAAQKEQEAEEKLIRKLKAEQEKAAEKARKAEEKAEKAAQREAEKREQQQSEEGHPVM